MNLLGITFANPALWAGALAVAVPVLVHLLARRTPTRMVFPTVQFLKKAEASQSLPYRLRHLIMMMLRTALVALLLLAFLKPVFHPKISVAAPAAGGKRAAVIVLDASLSMGYTGTGVMPFAKGQVAARTILESLDAADCANLILAAATPHASFDKPVPNAAGLYRDLDRAAPTLERADVDAALVEAVKQLEQVSSYAPELHIVSDFQRSNWASAKFRAIPKNVRTVFVTVAEEHMANAAITEISLQPAVPAAGEPIELLAKLANYGSWGRDVTVQLQLDGEAQEQPISLAPGMTETARFRVKPLAQGVHEGTVRIEADALEGDDVRYFTVNATDRVHVLILTHDPQTDPLASHRFVSRAINPFLNNEGSIVAEILSPDRLDKFAASKAHLIILAGVNDLSPETAGLLTTYLKDGGSLIYFLGRPSDKANLQRLKAKAKGELQLPFALRGMRNLAEAEPPAFATWAGANFDDPMLRKFKEDANLGDIHFYRFFDTEREKGQGQILLSYADKNIAMARKSLGLGSLLLCNFSPGLQDSDLAKRPVFVPLLHEMIRNLRPQSGGMKVFHVGSAASTTVRLSAERTALTFTDATDRRVNAGFEENHGEAAVFFSETPHPGFYRIYEGGNRIGSIAVNVDNRESPLDTLAPEQLRELSNVPRDRFLSATSDDADRLGELIGGRPLWHYFMLAALCILGLEQVLALVWRK